MGRGWATRLAQTLPTSLDTTRGKSHTEENFAWWYLCLERFFTKYGFITIEPKFLGQTVAGTLTRVHGPEHPHLRFDPTTLPPLLHPGQPVPASIRLTFGEHRSHPRSHTHTQNGQKKGHTPGRGGECAGVVRGLSHVTNIMLTIPGFNPRARLHTHHATPTCLVPKTRDRQVARTQPGLSTREVKNVPTLVPTTEKSQFHGPLKPQYRSQQKDLGPGREV